MNLGQKLPLVGNGTGGDGGRSSSNADSGGSGDADGSWGGVGAGVGVLDDGGGAADLDDVLSTDWDWDWHLIRPLDVDGGGDLHDLLDVLDDVVGDGVGLLHVDGLVDDVVVDTGLDDGGVHGLGALESSGDSDVELGDDWLQHLGVVAGDVLLGAVVDLLGHHWGGLVHGFGGWGLDAGAVGGGHADGSWGGGDSHGGSGHDSWGSGDGWGSGDSWGSADDASWGSVGTGDDASGESTSVPQRIVGDQLSGGGDGAGDDSRQDGSHGVHDAKFVLSEDK